MSELYKGLWLLIPCFSFPLILIHKEQPAAAQQQGPQHQHQPHTHWTVFYHCHGLKWCVSIYPCYSVDLEHQVMSSNYLTSPQITLINHHTSSFCFTETQSWPEMYFINHNNMSAGAWVRLDTHSASSDGWVDKYFDIVKRYWVIIVKRQRDKTKFIMSNMWHCWPGNVF